MYSDLITRLLQPGLQSALYPGTLFAKTEAGHDTHDTARGGLPAQARREELLQTVQTLERLMEQESSEHVQLRAERDTLADCVRNLQQMQLQPQAPLDLRAQVGEAQAGILNTVRTACKSFTGKSQQ